MPAKANPTAFRGNHPDAELFDISQWPIVFARFPELHEPDRVMRTLSGIDRLLDQKVPFVAAWIPASHHHEEEPHEDEKKVAIWMKHRKTDLATYCAGYVYVVTDPKMRALLEERIPAVRKLLPFPKELAYTRDEARRIAEQFLAARQYAQSGQNDQS